MNVVSRTLAGTDRQRGHAVNTCRGETPRRGKRQMTSRLLNDELMMLMRRRVQPEEVWPENQVSVCVCVCVCV